MQCQLCQHENHSVARYCGGCGQPLRVSCVSCGAENSPENRFCDGCGASLQQPARPGSRHAPARVYTPAHLAQEILTSPSALEGERKQVTVLFCDMVNSTELAQSLGADAMHELLNQVFELALAEVHRVEGTINQFLGDGFMALFGAPVAHEDDVRRALLCALGIRQKLKEAAQGDSTAMSKVHLRMGLNTGMVVVGAIGDNLRSDYTAVGDTTHIAARLQQIAQSGQILVNQGVYTTGHPYFEFSALGTRALKGIKERVAVYDLIKARPREISESRARRLRIGSPLVGRDQELASLQQVLVRLGRGEGATLILSGEPGVGKSRLVADARRQLSGSDILWLEGRAVSFGRSLSYLPFIEILKDNFGIGDDDTEDDSWRKLEQGVTALFAERTPEVLPYLAPLLALRVPPELEARVKYLDGPGLRRQVFLCMRQLFEHLARRQPIVLLLEDWHWADQSSIELVEHLLPLTDSTPLLAFFATRPDPDGPSARVRQFASSQPGRRIREIVLAPLTQQHSSELMANLIGALDLPAALHEQILRKTEGNPFFMEEVIRSLVTDGVLVRDARDQSWQLVRQVDQVQLPDTIQGLILARIDRLEEDVKQALKLASVIGRSFFNRVLEVISKAPPNLDRSLAELEHAELIRQRQQLPEIEYIFKHALVQEAAYGSILAENRRAIHRRVAQAIEMLFEDRLDEFTSLLAHHYTCAQDSDKAQEYLFKAGDQAGKMAADTEALEHFRLAEGEYLKAFGDKLRPLQRAALARKIGAALYGTGHYEQALEQFRRALSQLGLHYPATRWGVRRAIAGQLGAHFTRRLRRWLGVPAKRELDLESANEISTICHFMSWMDHFLDKERMLLDCLLELHAGENSHYAMAEARGLSSLGFGFMTFHALRLSRAYHVRAGEIAQRTNNPSAIAFVTFALGFLDFYDGRWDACDSNLGKAAATYRDAGDLHRSGGATLMRSLVVNFRGDLAQTSAMATELMQAGQDAADPQLASWGLLIRGYAELASGPLDVAVANLRKGVAMAAKIPAWDTFLYQKSLLSKCLVLQGKFEQALAGLDEALEVITVEQFGRPFDKVEVLMAVATCRLAIAERADGASRSTALHDARRASHQALQCARQMPLWLPQALRLHGTSEWLAGNESAGQKYWRESVLLAEKYDFPIESARTWLEIGDRLGDVALIERACEVFLQQGANVFLAAALYCQARLCSRTSSDAASARSRYARAIGALEEVKADEHLVQARDAYARLQDQPG